MDTWATSSCTPLILGGWPDDTATFAERFPMSLRPQAHDIIRTWAFYSIVKALAHTGTIPWRDVMISGHGLSTERRKISKSKNHDEIGPLEVIERESADALRYWATSGHLGADSPYTPETIATGRRLVTKLWNAGRFAAGRLAGFEPGEIAMGAIPAGLGPTDRWLLARLARTIVRATAEMETYEYAAARAEVERFFWSDLCDNYLELAKARLYGEEGEPRRAAQWTLYHALLAVLKLFAPYLPYITEALYQGIFREHEGATSIHRARWPEAPAEWSDDAAEAAGAVLLELLGEVRRFKAERRLSVGAELAELRIAATSGRRAALAAALVDLQGATRARAIVLEERAEAEREPALAITACG